MKFTAPIKPSTLNETQLRQVGRAIQQNEGNKLDAKIEQIEGRIEDKLNQLKQQVEQLQRQRQSQANNLQEELSRKR